MVSEMKKRKLGLIITAAVLSFSITACGSSLSEMTEEQNAQVVEYAAGLLLKYDQNYHSRLLEEEAETSGQEEESLSAEKGEVQSQAESQKEETSAAETPEAKEETPVIDRSEAAQQTAYSSIEQFYSIDGVAITYEGYELKDQYPEMDSEDMFFAMNATKGSKLLVLYFDVANVAGQDLNLDMLSKGTKFKISVNGEAPRYALTTMLTDDLSSYVGTIAADSSEKLVLVAEVAEEKTESIQSISLTMKNVSEDATISLN